MLDRRELLKLRISENFHAMMETLECILDPINPIKSMTVTGASGIGKSFNIINRLQEAHDTGYCNYFYQNGKCTTMGLYMKMYEARHLGSVLLLDDIDVYDSEDKLNIMKAALETNERRTISYMSTSRILQEEGIPTQFDFNGKIVFITNKDLVKLSQSKSALSDHIDALMTRGSFIDLEIFDNESIMVHIENIMNSTNIVKKYGITQEVQQQFLDFMLKHCDKLRKPSLRMPVQIAGMYLQNPSNWEAQALKMCVKPDKI